MRKAQFENQVKEIAPQDDLKVQTSPEKSEGKSEEFKNRRARRRRKSEESGEQISERTKLGERRRTRKLETITEDSKKPEDEVQEILQEANKLFLSNKDKKKALQEQLRTLTTSPITENARYLSNKNNTF